MATQRENWREDVAGRANVEDTPELLAYYDPVSYTHLTLPTTPYV